MSITTKQFYGKTEVATLKAYAPRVDRSETFLRHWHARTETNPPAPVFEEPTADGRIVRYYAVSELNAWLKPILKASAARIARGVGRPRKVQ